MSLLLTSYERAVETVAIEGPRAASGLVDTCPLWRAPHCHPLVSANRFSLLYFPSYHLQFSKTPVHAPFGACQILACPTMQPWLYVISVERPMTRRPLCSH